MDANCGFVGKPNEDDQGIFFSRQPENGYSVDFSGKLDPSVILLTCDGECFARF